jgi:tetratricopeptide (TPR) repeat protein
VGALPRPELPDGPVRVLFDRLHDLHHHAGWPSLRAMAKDVGCSHTTIAGAFSGPRLPRWGLLELIVETLGGDTDVFHRLWLAASRAPEQPELAEPYPLGLLPQELPADVVAFTGRAEQLAALDALLARSGSAPGMTIAAISGTAGVGKTALAVHWGHRVAARFPHGQLYVNLRGYDPDTPLSATDALDALLRALGVAGTGIPHDLAQRAARYRSLVAGRRMLVLLDNAHSVDQIRDLLPGTPSSFVVVTSRDALPALIARHGAVRVNLDLLPPAEAVALLRTLVGARVDTEPEHAAALAHRCARLPLALRIAAEMAIARPAAPLAELADEVGEEPGRLDRLAAGDDEYTAVRPVFSWSLRHLSDPAAAAFTLLGLHPGAELDRVALAALTGADSVTARRLADTFTRAHLLDDLGTGRFGRHDLLRAYAAERAGRLNERVRRAALTRLLDHYLDAAAGAVRLAFPAQARAGVPDLEATRFGSAGEAMAWLDAERSNLLAVARSTVDSSAGHTVRLSATVAPYLDACAHYQDALTLHALAGAAARATGDRAGEGTTRHAIGLTCWRIGRYGEAFEHYQDALTLHALAGAAARATGDRTGEGRSASLLATVHRRLGEYHRALDSYAYALAIHREVGDRAGEGTTRHAIGLTCWRIGRYGEAFEHITEALAIYRETGDRVGEGSALYGLGLVQLQLGRYDEALAQHERALAVHREVGDRISEGRAINNLGNIYQRLGRHAAARQEYQRSLTIAREVGNRVGEAVALINLADIDTQLGCHDDARRRYEQGLALCRQIGYRVGQADALRGLGVVSARLGQRDEAVEHLSNAVALCQALGEQDTGVQALLDLGDVLRAAGRPVEALSRYRAAHALAGQAPDRYALARTLTALAGALQETGETAEARQHLERATALDADLRLPDTGVTVQP